MGHYDLVEVANEVRRGFRVGAISIPIAELSPSHIYLFETFFTPQVNPQENCKHIPRHRGKHKGIIRYHLGLKVPQPVEQCYIQVDDQIAYWKEGESLIFDDTYYHEVWNNTDGYRAVLFLDIVRPLRFPLSLVNWLVCRLVAASPIIQDARRSHDAWEEKFEAEV